MEDNIENIEKFMNLMYLSYKDKNLTTRKIKGKIYIIDISKFRLLSSILPFKLNKVEVKQVKYMGMVYLRW